MLKRDLIKRIEELEKENQELKVKHQNEVSATFALTTAMQMIMANQVGNFVKPKKEEISIYRFPKEKEYQDTLSKQIRVPSPHQAPPAEDKMFEGEIVHVELGDKKYKVNQELEIGEVGYVKGKLVRCEEDDHNSCTRCTFKNEKPAPGDYCPASLLSSCTERKRKDGNTVYFEEVVEVEDEEN